MKRLILLSGILLCLCASAQDTLKRAIADNALVDVVRDMSAGGRKPAEILERMKKLEQFDPDNDAVQFYLAKALQACINPIEAEKHYLKAIELDPGNNKYREALADLYTMTNQGAEAAKVYLYLLESDPGRYRNAYTLTAIGDDRLSQGKDTLALESYDNALLYDPDYVPAILGKAEIYRQRGNIPAFFVQMQQFAADRNLLPSAKCDILERILERIDAPFYKVWGAQLDSTVSYALAAHPTDSSTLKMAGKWFYRTPERKRGEECFAKLLELYPESVEAHEIQLSLLFAAGDRQGMVDECKRILALVGDNKERRISILSTLGDCYHDIGDRKRTYECYDKVLKLDPECVQVLNNYAYFLCLEGRSLAKAEKMSRKSVQKEPDNPTFLDTLGWILHLRGKDAEAKSLFKHAMVYGGKEHKEILLHFSEVLKTLGEKELSDYYRILGESRK